ncbi:MerR family transcriptional regulator [Actinoplanes utahensis]|uniref:MerR family transcriptional regulator n=1 Tax=Actinoplanes utahensis TaxID=1869 RepID=A0A0A6URF3_ACTUT|nr:MerR family transcriptional regulator [Actinoplanes utahensis]KHD78705.1 MerR family transcriptional regulator [Actinoplanes utahensis]GIF32051.1 MerR family transcriptional regulator [Actinoplanes utahensis]
MFAIGDFARHGRVSVRMLRHYDAIGLLRPAHVDPVTGYRRYSAAQLARLNRIIALKNLGFTLQQVHDIVAGTLSTEELRGMLRLRRAELAAAVTASEARLAQVEARLRAIESEGHMPTNEVVIKRIPPVRVAEITAVAASYEPEDIGPVIGPLYDELCRRMESAGVTPSGPGIAYYVDAPEGGVTVHAAIEVAADRGSGDLEVRDLPVIEEAATIVHHGPMEAIVPVEQGLARWVEANGYTALGYAREVNLECPERKEDWVTELQLPVRKV